MKIADDQWIVLTGGAGFIGSCVLRELNDNGLFKVLVVDELDTSDKWKNLVGKSYHEIIDKSQLFDWLQGKEQEIGAFIHLGACTSTVETDSGYLLENNYRYSIKLAEYALKNGQRFIYASSAATYGDGLEGFEDNHDRLESLKPLNMYGYSKHLFDLWLKGQSLLDRVVGLKYFNVFGPNESHKGRMASAVTHILPAALKDGVVRLFKSNDPGKYPDGGQQRDFINVKDAARMTCAFLKNEDTGIFNIGTGKPSTWKELAESVFLAINKPPCIEYIPMPNDLLKIYQNFTCADMHKTRKSLKKEAQCMTLEEGVADYIQNFLLPEKRW